MSQYNITLQEGIEWTTQWRDEHPGLVKAFKIDKAEIQQIMIDNPGIAGIRCYLGLEGSSNEPKLIIVAVDSDGKDILENVYDHAGACPPTCDNSSVLCVGN